MSRATNDLMNDMKPKKEKYYTPTMNKKAFRKIKCKHPGCKATFVAYPNTMYCEKHRKTNRKVERVPIVQDVFIMEYEFTEKVIVERNCNCCGKPYRIDIVPGGKHWPAYCEDHRNEYKRTFYTESLNAKKTK